MQNIVIFGASGHGSVVLDSLEREGKYNIIGFIDSFKKKGVKHNGYEILGNEYELLYLMERYNIIGGVVAIGDNWSRHLIVEKINKIVPNFNFVLAIHPNAIVGKDVEIGKGAVIMPGAIINANSRIGRHCIVNTNSSIGHDSIVEDFSSLAPRACAGGNFILGEFSAVSLGVNIIEKITILEHTVIGAGSLILKDVPGYVVAYGNPAKVIKNRRIGEVYLSGSRGHLAKIVVK